MHGGTIYKQNNTFTLHFHFTVQLLCCHDVYLHPWVWKIKVLVTFCSDICFTKTSRVFAFPNFSKLIFQLSHHQHQQRKRQSLFASIFFPRFFFFPFLTTPSLGDYFKETTALAHVPNVLTIIRSTQFFDSFHSWLNCCFRHTQRLSRYLFLSNTMV